MATARLNIICQKPPGASQTAPEFSDEDRLAWPRRLADELARHGWGDQLDATFETDAGPLRLVAQRSGAAYSATWSAGSPPAVVAVSAFLCGKDGADDAAAFRAFREHPDLADLPITEFTPTQAEARPCVGTIFTSAAWYDNGRVELAASALAAAVMAGPGSPPTMEEPADATPEQLAASRREIEAVSDLFRIIQNDWSTRRKLRYTVRPNERVSGRPAAEIMGVKFWVGVQGQGRTVGVNELVALFLLLNDFVEKAPNLRHMRKPQTRHTVQLRHSPAVIEAVLAKIQMTEPG